MLHNKKGVFFTLTAMAFATSAVLPAHATIVASIKPVGFIASAIADGVTPVDVLLPDGASEHDYALRPSDVKRLQNAELVVWVGPEMEAFMTKSAAALPEKKNLEIVQISGVKQMLLRGGEDDDHHDHDDTEHDHDAEHHHHHGEFNMHLWMSPEIAKKPRLQSMANYWNLCRRIKPNLTPTCSTLRQN